jgi:hypothetical protein
MGKDPRVPEKLDTNSTDAKRTLDITPLEWAAKENLS